HRLGAVDELQQRKVVQRTDFSECPVMAELDAFRKASRSLGMRGERHWGPSTFLVCLLGRKPSDARPAQPPLSTSPQSSVDDRSGNAWESHGKGCHMTLAS